MSENTAFERAIRRKRREFKLLLWIIFLIIIFIFILLFDNIVVPVKSGHVGVKWKRFLEGTITDRYYDEGTHFLLPWNKMYIYDIRQKEISDTLNVLTINGLTIHLSMSYIFRPNKEMIGYLHKEIGQDYAQKILVPLMRSVVRSIIGQYTPEEFYTSQKDIIENIVQLSAQNANHHFIRLDNLLVKELNLPAQITKAIENKLKQQQIAQQYEFIITQAEKDAKRKLIEAEAIKKYNKILSEGLDSKVLQWHGIEATKKISESENAKVIIIGPGKEGLPLILGDK